jgi:hypothetical protein
MGAWICLAEPANIFRSLVANDHDKIAERAANRVIGRAAFWLFRRNLLLLLFPEEPVKLVIFTHRSLIGCG